MSERLRFGAPPDLDAALFVWRLDQPPWSDHIELTLAPPGELARRLESRALDVALVPALAVAARCSEWQVVPGMALGSPGPSAAVRLDHRVPLADIRRIATLAAGHTAEALVQILFAESGRPVMLSAWDGPPEEALKAHGAVLLAGDPAILGAPAAGVESLDLAHAWASLTGSPVVWSLCAAWPGAVTRKHYSLLHSVRSRARREAALLVEGCAARTGAAPDRIRDVIESQTSHRLGRRELESLALFFAAALRAGLITAQPTLQFLPLAEAKLCRRLARELRLGG